MNILRTGTVYFEWVNRTVCELSPSSCKEEREVYHRLPDNLTYDQKCLAFFQSHLQLSSPSEKARRSYKLTWKRGPGSGSGLFPWAPNCGAGHPSLDWVGGERSYRSGLSPSSIRLVTTGFPLIRVRLKGVVGFSCAARGLWATAAKKRAM